MLSIYLRISAKRPSHLNSIREAEVRYQVSSTPIQEVRSGFENVFFVFASVPAIISRCMDLTMFVSFDAVCIPRHQ
jgi:hypothetical protein